MADLNESQPVELIYETDHELDHEERIENEAPKRISSAMSFSQLPPMGLEFNLTLPEPNALQRKKREKREGVKSIYDYYFRNLIRFDGKEIIPKPFLEDPGYISRISAKVYRDRAIEKKLKEIPEDAPELRGPRLYNYFEDEDSIVYRRDEELIDYNEENFNMMKFNLKKYMIRGELENVKLDLSLDEKEKRNPFRNEFYGCYYQPEGKYDTTLVFESRFESGNLSIASKVSDKEYNLVMQNDINTLGYNQWFFFEARNTRKSTKVKFNILNYRKDDSLYNHGMKVLVYSVQDKAKQGIGWVRAGENLSYNVNDIVRDFFPNKLYRTFSFEYEFQNDYDRVFFAYSHPYTYSDLCDYLDKLEADEIKSKLFIRSMLCRTISGNRCDLVTLTNNRAPGDCDDKKCIVLTARVHPGETMASYMIQGVIDFLLSDDPTAEELRNKFIFKIIPMLNPDGVIHGNYRCDLSGNDLNRRWRHPSPALHPTIYSAKNLCKELQRRNLIAFYCDFHGHSKKQKAQNLPQLNRKNVFLYGCEDKKAPFRNREFPWILAKIAPGIFDFLSCHFNIQRCMAGTARITMFEQIGVNYSYTLESSFFGSDRNGKHFTIEDFLKFGATFCRALNIHSSITDLATGNRIVPGQNSGTENNQDVNQNEMYTEYMNDLYANDKNIRDDDDSGSDSQASADDFPHELRAKLIPDDPRKTKKQPKIIPRYNKFTAPKESENKKTSSLSPNPFPTKPKVRKYRAERSRTESDEDKKSPSPSKISEMNQIVQVNKKKEDEKFNNKPVMMPKFPPTKKVQGKKSEVQGLDFHTFNKKYNNESTNTGNRVLKPIQKNNQENLGSFLVGNPYPMPPEEKKVPQIEANSRVKFTPLRDHSKAEIRDGSQSPFAPNKNEFKDAGGFPRIKVTVRKDQPDEKNISFSRDNSLIQDMNNISAFDIREQKTPDIIRKRETHIRDRLLETSVGMYGRFLVQRQQIGFTQPLQQLPYIGQQSTPYERKRGQSMQGKPAYLKAIEKKVSKRLNRRTSMSPRNLDDEEIKMMQAVEKFLNNNPAEGKKLVADVPESISFTADSYQLAPKRSLQNHVDSIFLDAQFQNPQFQNPQFQTTSQIMSKPANTTQYWKNGSQGSFREEKANGLALRKGLDDRSAGPMKGLDEKSTGPSQGAKLFNLIDSFKEAQELRFESGVKNYQVFVNPRVNKQLN